jgi:hypothetical protein
MAAVAKGVALLAVVLAFIVELDAGVPPGSATF